MAVRPAAGSLDESGSFDDALTAHAALTVDESVHEKEDVAEQHIGPRLEFSCDDSPPETAKCRVLVTSPTDACGTSRLTIHNAGTTCVFYTWQRKPAATALNTRQDGVNRFFLDVTPGCILPGDSVEVNVTFSSPNPGVFTEPWELICQPALPIPPVISLCGTFVRMPPSLASTPGLVLCTPSCHTRLCDNRQCLAHSATTATRSSNTRGTRFAPQAPAYGRTSTRQPVTHWMLVSPGNASRRTFAG